MVSLLSRIVAPLLVLLFLTAGPAQAHDQLIGTQPTDGASLKEAPQDLTLTFSGALSDIGAQVTVTNGGGDSFTDGDPRVQGVDLIQDLAELPKGDYEVLWRVTSEDGHPISGSFVFAVT
ncbi:MAG: copper resistance protein CopC, partial [Ornithinimicrobium sp.]|uniref:copper resistance CopC family protein n=1 Tax=Ornithinimicrobium sp. TaxID=1977084 RepID=UPI0026DF89BE